MNKEEMIKNIAASMGNNEESDYVIDPTKHANGLQEKAPELAEILRDKEVEVAATKYKERDEQAWAAQARFKSLAAQTRWAVLFTAFFGAVLMLLGTFAEKYAAIDDQKWIYICLALAEMIAGAWGAVGIFQIRGGNMLEEWMHQRALSETHRLAYFAAVTKRHHSIKENPDRPVLLQQLEYFRRYQLDVQLAYYKNRGARHAESARKTLMLSGVAASISALAGTAAGILGYAWAPLASVGGLAVLGAALSSFVSSKEGVNQDKRNAERYDKTYNALQALEGRLTAVRRSVARGSRDVLEKFVAAVHETLSLEHRQWLSEAEAISGSITALEDALNQLTDKDNEKMSTTAEVT